MKYLKEISTEKEWVWYISRKNYMKIKNSKWERFKWRINPLNCDKLKVYQNRRIK